MVASESMSNVMSFWYNNDYYMFPCLPGETNKIVDILKDFFCKALITDRKTLSIERLNKDQNMNAVNDNNIIAVYLNWPCTNTVSTGHCLGELYAIYSIETN